MKVRIRLVDLAAITVLFAGSVNTQAADLPERLDGSTAITDSLTKGLDLLNGFVGSIFNPVAADFKKKVSEGKLDDALGAYALNAREFRANRELDSVIRALLLDARRAKA